MRPAVGLPGDLAAMCVRSHRIDAFREAIDTITPTKCANYFMASEYEPE